MKKGRRGWSGGGAGQPRVVTGRSCCSFGWAGEQGLSLDPVFPCTGFSCCCHDGLEPIFMPPGYRRLFSV